MNLQWCTVTTGWWTTRKPITPKKQICTLWGPLPWIESPWFQMKYQPWLLTTEMEVRMKWRSLKDGRPEPVYIQAECKKNGIWVSCSSSWQCCCKHWWWPEYCWHCFSLYLRVEKRMHKLNKKDKNICTRDQAKTVQCNLASSNPGCASLATHWSVGCFLKITSSVLCSIKRPVHVNIPHIANLTSSIIPRI